MPDDYGNANPDWLEIDWRQHLHHVALPGAEVNYAEIGEGEPIVFIHGISGSWQNWLENLPHFGRSHRAIALDLPGFGEIGVERGAALVGNPMGGLVAGEAVLSAPERFDRLVFVSAAGLINTWLPHQRGKATSHAWRTFGPHYRRAADAIVRNRLLRYLTFRFAIRYPGRLRRELLWEQLANGVPCEGFADALDAVLEYDARDRLEEIEIPTMIVWGFEDWVISALAALSYHRRIPHSRLEIFERTGHVPQLERPARFNRLLDDFLAG